MFDESGEKRPASDTMYTKSRFCVMEKTWYGVSGRLRSLPSGCSGISSSERVSSKSATASRTSCPQIAGIEYRHATVGRLAVASRSVAGRLNWLVMAQLMKVVTVMKLAGVRVENPVSKNFFCCRRDTFQTRFRSAQAQTPFRII